MKPYLTSKPWKIVAAIFLIVALASCSPRHYPKKHPIQKKEVRGLLVTIALGYAFGVHWIGPVEK